jgi:hypothetical protein
VRAPEIRLKVPFRYQGGFMNAIAKYVLCMAAVLGLWIPAPANAQSCTTFLTGINNWFLTQPKGSGTYSINFTMASNRTDGTYVSYSEGGSGTPGIPAYHPATSSGFFRTPAYLQGTLTEYFSDRRYVPPPGLGFPWAPFNPGNTDSLGVTIYLGNAAPRPLGNGATLGEVVLTLKSWGNASYSFQGLCTDNMLYGFLALPPTNVPNLFVASLNESFSPPIH